ncbi:response regulator [Candidatus Methanoperedens nitroreducens]|uniref:Response regulator n=1 Tax=Candidatus Methanoperedens nitratireducens TaxID=1392998 RepID=A0A062V3E3_9EURY|nr:response regulator [Candidatus Methanoperedens nitroreducens]KCZ71138.1 response regulator [Candidatus Methanoperedens nitroreducens]MDJ1421484.1 response regulator [Candidatus Methanoperedens sp.]
MIPKKSNYVLIVNSEPEIADLFAEMLLIDIEKYRFNIAHTGRDCLITMKRDMPDMILLDIELSDMDGWELIKKIKELKPGMPVVIITAKPPCMDDFSRLSMVSDYLVKPVTIDCLHMAVRDALEIPPLLDKCLETMNISKDEDLSVLEKNILLLRQGISDRKLFILMRQLYPDRKLKNDSHSRLLLDDLRLKIDRAHNELEEFRRGCLIA